MSVEQKYIGNYGYLYLAIALVKSATREHDELFLESAYGKSILYYLEECYSLLRPEGSRYVNHVIVNNYKESL